jgi:hypothetical protein
MREFSSRFSPEESGSVTPINSHGLQTDSIIHGVFEPLLAAEGIARATLVARQLICSISPPAS